MSASATYCRVELCWYCAGWTVCRQRPLGQHGSKCTVCGAKLEVMSYIVEYPPKCTTTDYLAHWTKKPHFAALARIAAAPKADTIDG